MNITLKSMVHAMVCAALLSAVPVNVCAQAENSYVHEQSSANDYVWPTDPQVLAKLDKWQDLKFGVIMHWGLYSIPGMVESWNLCSEDWIHRNSPLAYDDYKKWYWGMSKDFNPQNFNPDQWAEMMQEAGMKYMIFTTKHHDGFCMFDTKETEFSIANGKFRDDARKDVAKCVFDAFRKKNFYIGCYFSKPDWHSEWFWNPEYATPNRQINYKRNQHPDWWRNYVSFTQRQLNELTTNYGPLDILWLDGGWITGDDIGLDSLLVEARKRHPGLISVDRAIRGRNENYQTPERGIPETQLRYPWESCITLSYDWGWTPNAPYKSAQWIINTLAQITAKGGCFVLGIGPDKNGEFDPNVKPILHKAGNWLQRYGKAIYSTRPTDVYNDGKIWFTGSKDGHTVYAIYALPEKESLPKTITWTGNVPTKSVKLVSNGKRLKFTKRDGRVTVTLPAGLAQEPFALEIN